MAAKPDMVAEVEMADSKGVFSLAHDDVSVNILADMVGKTWNQSCNKILCRPQFSSALSLNPDLHAALDEVLADASSKPLRPDFIITEKVGPGIPVITNKAKGLIGTDVQTDKLREVIWGSTDGDSERNENNSNRGIVLSVGYMPGLKVDVIPLLRPKTEQQLTKVDHFLMEIMDFTCAASGSLSPSCIIMFGDKNVDMNPILTILDQVMPDETAIVGDASAAFLCTRMDEAENYNKDAFSFAAAALVFTRDQYKPEDVGETEFHVTVSNGLIPFGPHLKTVSVLEKHCLCSWVSAIMLGFESVIIDCYDVLNGTEKPGDVSL
ncbi:F-box/LRR-repeat protein [Prunus yedoensis var. nudiflora]|uniref:F-box/LRR-repeat protein n=1 Tax=Prunus yedoensis var. nudiflora TaxID=2094558 RepID=A0A314UGK2_PRUYE|nr:F-box/LRR-repeat protein [Prunus yedoensis var. nudiflora]